MAAIQAAERSRYGYVRAARALLDMDDDVGRAVADGTLRNVPFIGPSSAKIVGEFVRERRSPTLDDAIARSGKAAQVVARRALREGFLSRHAMERAHRSRRPAGVVNRRTFRGDLQMHSTWSDGRATIAAMAQACIERGHRMMGITDHSYGLPLARGMSMGAVERQHREIDGLNATCRGRFRIFKGIEANIFADGSLDLQADERRVFEYVIASPHALLRRTEDQTRRMVAAVETSGVTILGHPRGRMYDRRAGVVANWVRVFEAAAARGVAIEIDGHWHRQDVDWQLARSALDLGCLFALDSDAHTVDELRFTDYAVAHARLAGIPAERVVNCWPEDRLERWMTRLRAA